MADRTKKTHDGEKPRPQVSQTYTYRKLMTEPVRVDELIVSLANARENCRARQVVEWERLYHDRRISTR